MSTPQPEAPIPAAPDAELLATRYGRTPQRARRTRVVGIAGALVFLVVLVGWVVWAGLGTPAQFKAQDAAHTIISDSETSVQWEFSVSPGTPASCAVQALNSTFAIVGWKVVDLPASDTYTRVLTETVRTTERAVSGLIYRCWLT